MPEGLRRELVLTSGWRGHEARSARPPRSSPKRRLPCGKRSRRGQPRDSSPTKARGVERHRRVPVDIFRRPDRPGGHAHGHGPVLEREQARSRAVVSRRRAGGESRILNRANPARTRFAGIGANFISRGARPRNLRRIIDVNIGQSWRGRVAWPRTRGHPAGIVVRARRPMLRSGLDEAPENARKQSW